MTPLEQHILDEAKKEIKRAKLDQDAVTKETTCRWLKYTFMCDDVMDILVYDVKEKRFTKIEYSVGKGEGIRTPFNRGGAYYDPEDIEWKEILIP